MGRLCDMRVAVILKGITRRIIFAVPRVRRFYAHVSQLADENARLREELAGHVAATNSSAAKFDKAKRDLEKITRDRDDLELQLYVLRSDFLRVVGQAEELRL